MLAKIKHLIQRFMLCCKALPGDVREFGWKVSACRFWDVLIPTGKSKGYIEALSGYMTRELAPVTERYCRGEWSAPEEKATLNKIPVWVCWWQGEENMPPIVKACVRKMRAALPENARLHIITWENLESYIQLPDYIMEKFQKGLITNVHLTDILRYGLMCRYGGAWIDATVWLSDGGREILSQGLEQAYFTQRFASWDSCPQEACRGKWCNFFFMGKKESPLFCFVYEALLQWWQNHDKLIDYVIVDYVLWAGYQGVPEIRSAIDAVEPGNENIWLLAKKLNDAYDPTEFGGIMAKNQFFKLSYKGRLELETEDGQKTVYAHILEENG